MLDELLQVAGDRPAAAHATGLPVVGCVGADVPVEVLTAAGFLPLRLAGDPDAPSDAGDLILGRGVDPVARSVLTCLLDGGYGPLAALVVSRDCEASLRLFYAVRELHRTGDGAALPPVHLVDVLHLPHRSTTAYVLAKVRELRAQVARWSGHDVADDALAAAVAAHDRVRTLLGRVATLRRVRPARLSGMQALAVVAATTALPPDRAAELLDGLLAQPLPDVTGTRVFLTGSSHDHPGVYAALEQAGLLVVGEDHDWGDLLHHRRVDPPPDPALLELAIAERYQHNGPTAARASMRQRAAHTAAAARACGAEALPAYARIRDDAPRWDFPAQRAATGLPAVLLEHQPYGRVDLDAMGALRAEVAA
ncbi:2-hydroxyacyl-CoA dehydratase family protein [Pseudonocardia cypriaca]|uniref:2-hydroxyglutaryl-CoA dehydratase D-component n=1 Tax=Pseudonocardia cypriaca TaxID=882449 RepID=A0A543GGC3_9PSEU|nr:2-hydroxyacyl-CoA dehydratase family protein [Pseudonocardia cypriaca]TQM45124.1 2-hydroxyglutaryl-CoA dehydratase D-component [Pseudonocardia cypriaca]